MDFIFYSSLVNFVRVDEDLISVLRALRDYNVFAIFITF